MQYQVLQTFANYIEAHIVLGRFEEAGIKCWLKDENTVTIDPILTNAVGGIKLMVAANDMEKATELMHSIRQQQIENYICPRCSSNNIEYINTPRKAINWFGAILSWLLGSYAVSVEKTWHCFDCGYEFETPVELHPTDIAGED